MASLWKQGGFSVQIFGESHGAAIGVVLDGLPSGEPVDFDKILAYMARRAPRGDGTSTTRAEKDFPTILSGVYGGCTTGTPLAATIQNTDTRSADYGNSDARALRPSHADYAGHLRYGGFEDFRGGGHFSGRLTAPLVFAGAVLAQILERRGISVGAHIWSVADIFDDTFDAVNVTAEVLNSVKAKSFPTIDDTRGAEMIKCIKDAGAEGDSVGGICECAVVGIPAGRGDPMFDGLENLISRAVFAIPAVRGIEFGAGFAAAAMFGSEHNDALFMKDGGVSAMTNNAGGVNGGISNGMPIVFRAAFKPTPSILKPQKTVTADGEDVWHGIKGRHDPCVAVRAVPVVECAAAVAIFDAVVG